MENEHTGIAADRDTCTQFLALAKRVFAERRIAYPVLSHAAYAVSYLETALRTSGPYAWGQALPGSPAVPENYEAL